MDSQEPSHNPSDEKLFSDDSSVAGAPSTPDLQASGNAASQSNVIRNYELIRQLGEGGMGEVWLARQMHPVKRMVALKIIKAFRLSAERLSRFEAEGQTLALMDHPNVAQIHDAGTTEDQLPFLAMEWIDGIPVTEYCDRYQLTVDQRLELFIEICHGVQHAHQKGIIHRDLKPGNILIANVDGLAKPKIIDFGLAKVVSEENASTIRSALTTTGQVMGTLKYMSPEQAKLDPQVIDTRTDIYSLGVLLNELLTGRTPLENDILRGAPILTLLERICEFEAAKPSSQLGEHSPDKLSQITANRQTDRSNLSRVLTGDLDWVVLKALEKSPDRRYETAAGLAGDLKRYLAGETVEARPPSLNYRLQKFVSRNRVGVVLSSVIAVTMLAGFASTGLALVRAWSAEESAQSQFQASEVARNQAVVARANEELRAIAEAEARKEAEDRLLKLQGMTKVLAGVFDELNMSSLSPSAVPLKERLAERLKTAAEQLDEDATENATEMVRLKSRLAVTLMSLGYYDDAKDLLEESMKTLSEQDGVRAELAMVVASNLAVAYEHTGKNESAISLFESSLKHSSELLGPDHRTTRNILQHLTNLYINESEFENALDLLKQGEEFATDASLDRQGEYSDDAQSQMLKLTRAHYLVRTGQAQQAVQLFEECLDWSQSELGEKHFQTISTQAELCNAYAKAGMRDEAFKLADEIVALAPEVYGEQSPKLKQIYCYLTNVYNFAKRPDLSISLLETMAVSDAALRDELDLMVLHQLGVSHSAYGEHAKAIATLQMVFDERNESLGADHLSTLATQNALGISLYNRKRYAEAIELLSSELKIRNQQGDKYSEDRARCLKALGLSYDRSGNTPASISPLKEALETQLEMGTDPAEINDTRLALAMSYHKSRNYQEAAKHFKKIVDFDTETKGEDHHDTIVITNNLAFSLAQIGRRTEAAQLYEKIYDPIIAEFGRDSIDGITTLNNIAMNYVALQEYRKAAHYLQQGWEAKQIVLGEKHAETLATKRLLEDMRARAGIPQTDTPQTGIAQSGIAQTNISRIDIPQTKNQQTGTPQSPAASNELLKQLEGLGQIVSIKPVSAGSEAEQLEKEIQSNRALVAHRKNTSGVDDFSTLMALMQLGISHYRAKDYTIAIEVFEELNCLLAAHPQHRKKPQLDFLGHLGHSYWNAQRFAAAADTYEDLMQIRTDQYGAADERTVFAKINLAVNLRESGQFNEAEKHLTEAMEIRLNPGRRKWVLRELADTYFQMGKTDLFVPLVDEVLQAYRTEDEEVQIGYAMKFSDQLLRLGQLEKSETLLRQVLEQRERTVPGSWQVGHTKSALGHCLMLQGQTEGVRELLVEGYELLKAQQSKIPEPMSEVLVSDALDRVTAFDAEHGN